MKKFLLKIWAVLAYPLVLLIAYDELHQAFIYDNACQIILGQKTEMSLFKWYLKDFVSNY